MGLGSFLVLQRVHSALLVPSSYLKSLIHEKPELVLILLAVLGVLMLIGTFGFIYTVMKAARREMQLSMRLIEKTEAAQKAETKCFAFANASHDIRASLACISALIEMCYLESDLAPDLKKNLQQMDSCAKDLLGLLNSILDTSKIEAGKMLLEEEEFDLVQLLEDVVDMFHPVAMKKGVDVVLDLYDDSILKNSMVKGDRGKLKQILSNLLSNAVKFTVEGHIAVRAWAQKPALDQDATIHDANGKVYRKKWSCLFFGKTEEEKDVKAICVSQRRPNSLELVIEVDDTGKGIPKQKRNSVFENFVQVNETAHGQGGTGLGLGIVQSLVHLMGGDIKIIDKETDERGTCFRFNILLSVSGDIHDLPDKPTNEDDTEVLSESLQDQGPSLQLPRSSKRSEGSSLAILLMGDKERRRVTRTFMERHGIRALVGSDWAELPSILRNAQRELALSCHSEFDNLVSSNSSGGSDLIKQIPRRFLLLVIDTSFGPFTELIRLVSRFRERIQINSDAAACKVVWLDKPALHYKRVLEEDCNHDFLNDVIITRPFHGTRLIEVMNLLPEFGGSGIKSTSASTKVQEIVDPDETTVGEIIEEAMDEARLLSGKRILLVEDTPVLSRFAKFILVELGATVDVCENGEEAVSLVSKRLIEQGRLAEEASSTSPDSPYTFIIMDCQMPIMNGYEATRRIREEEKKYNMRMPIIAVTAHTEEPELKMTFEAGMDSYLQKPLRKDSLLEVLRKLYIIT